MFYYDMLLAFTVLVTLVARITATDFSTLAGVEKSLETYFKKSFEEHEADIQLTEIPKGLAEGPGNSKLYGSDSGLIYFNKYVHYVVLPALSKFFWDLKKSGKHKTLPKVELFKGILRGSGYERNKIAQVTNSFAKEKFGVPFFNRPLDEAVTVLSDPLNYKSFAAWDIKMRKKFDSIAISELSQLYEDSPESSFTRRINGPNAGCYKGTFKLNSVVEDVCSLEFYHAEPNNDSMCLISDLFWIFFENPSDISAMARFVWYFAESSMFRRGQASILEWLLYSILRAEGSEIRLSWSWRNSLMNLDQIALSYLSYDDFERDFVQNISIVPYEVRGPFKHIEFSEYSKYQAKAKCGLDFLCHFTITETTEQFNQSAIKCVQDLCPDFSISITELRKSQISGHYLFKHPESAIAALTYPNGLKFDGSYVMMYGKDVAWFAKLNQHRIMEHPNWTSLNIDLDLNKQIVGFEVVRFILTKMAEIDSRLVQNLKWNTFGYFPYIPFYQSGFFTSLLSNKQIQRAETDFYFRLNWIEQKSLIEEYYTIREDIFDKTAIFERKVK